MQSIGGLEFNNSTPKVKIKIPTDVNGREKNIKIRESMQKKKSSISIVGVLEWQN